MVNFCLEALLLVLFVACVWCVAVTRFAFPPATAAAGWRDLHFGLLCALVLAVLVHVMLHWNWVCGVVTTRLLARREGKKRKWTEGE